ncbi:hypothetical protein CBS147333_10260 [Penicillium roqueforti]|nr:hypothetical protein CBS147333_10260 [Penicillium roqueforti]KAI3187030.1 hypothetical protein CBS147311_10223 [Penicillium roqueforti]KAI3260506.1 hypothetical protein CBS147308_10247 [Penicillium roqueforti]KAI3275577.1 hypothetical protein DTO003C3_10257 [Penicillium roqueforti]
MGVAATKVVCSELSRACADAERNGKSCFDPDLICQSDAFVKAAKALLKQLPVELKARPSRTLLASERSNTIHLPEELEAEFRKWRQDPQSFHLSLAERISSPVTVTRLQIPPIAEVYIRCSEADCTATLENVRLRFYCVIFHDLKEEITPNQPLTSEILNLITAAIGNTGAVDGFNETKTREKIKEWIKAGAKFSSLAKDLNGRGALFFTTLSKSHQEMYPCVGTDWIDSRPAAPHFLNGMPGSDILDGVFPDSGSTTLQALAQSRPTQITNNESPENGLYQVASTNVHVPSQTQQGQRRINNSSLQSGPIYSPSRLRMDNFPYMTDGYMTNGFTQPIRPFAESGPSSLFHGHSPDTVPYLQLGYDLRGFDFQGP